MQSLKKVINGSEFEFINEGWSTSSAWGHRSVLLYKGISIAEKKIRYYNRTWESYEFQSCMKACVDLAIKEKTEAAKDLYKMINKISRFTKKTAAEFRATLEDDQFIKDLKSLYKEL